MKPRDPDTVYAWLRRYREHGIRGLFNRPGRGRKPAFSPKSPEEAESEVLAAIGGPPEKINPHQTRWTLQMLSQVVPWLRGVCVSGVHQILSRLGISYKRARDYVRSPDADYAEKLSRVEQVLAEARENRETHVVVYQKFSLPSQKIGQRRTKTPLARQSYLTCYGIAAQVKRCTVVALHTFYTEIRNYPNAERIYLIQDNRAIHFHPNLIAALLPQGADFDKPTPPNWTGKPSKQIGRLTKLPIEIIQLPTYASWTNPIEKLWRWVRQSVIHLHRLSNDWQTLQDKVAAFMEQFKGGSDALLHYVGLLPN